MPRYRKLHTKVTESLDVNDMPDDFTRLLWVMLPLALCREGRGVNNPSWVRSKVFPLRQDVTLDMVTAALGWYALRKMTVFYSVNGRDYFHVPTFHKYQGNTVKEAESIYPAPPDAEPIPAEVETSSEPTPDEVETSSVTDSIFNIQYSDSDSDADAIGNSDAGASEEPPRRDILDDMLHFNAKKAQKRMDGWGNCAAAVFEICQAVSDKFGCKLPVVRASHNGTTAEKVRKNIDTWQSGATLLLEAFDDDLQIALDTLDEYRTQFDGGITISSPMSLTNVLPAFLAQGSGAASDPLAGMRALAQQEGWAI